MKKLEPWIWKISELAVGLVVGYLIWLTDPKHETNTLIASLSVGTLIALVFEVFRTSFWHEEKFEDVNSRVEQKFKEVDSRLEENFKKVDALDTRSSEIFLRLAALVKIDEDICVKENSSHLSYRLSRVHRTFLGGIFTLIFEVSAKIR